MPRRQRCPACVAETVARRLPRQVPPARGRLRARQSRPRLAEAAGWEPPSAKPRSLPRPLAGVAARQGQLPSRLFRAEVAARQGQLPSCPFRAEVGAGLNRSPSRLFRVGAAARQDRLPSRLFRAEVVEQPRPLHFLPLRQRRRSSQVGARRVGAAVQRPEAVAASEPHLEGAAGPPLGAAVAWARPHLEGAAVHQAAEVVSAPQAEAAVSHPVEAVAWRQAAPQVASGAHQRQAASAVHPVQAASAARPPRQVSAGRHQAAPAVPASPSPPGHRDHRHPGTAPTAAGRTSRASAVPLPPRVRRPGPARGPPSPPSIPGTPRMTRRTRQLPCCGSRRSYTRSRPVHLHSVHDVCRLGGRHRRVDQVHWHARRVVHPDPHGQPR